MKTLTIIGSTGSIGVSALEVIDFHRDKFKVGALAAGSNYELLAEQALRFEPAVVALDDERGYEYLDKELSHKNIKVLCGIDGVRETAAYGKSDMVLSAAVGSAGLLPTVSAIEAGKDIALANKETLVMAGELITGMTGKNKLSLLPVDSEHSAIFQCLKDENRSAVKRIILTASGGPFRQSSLEEMEKAGPGDALNHPTWDMGRKISIDSATLMNKGLEVIECKWLFDVEPDKIDVVIHPGSVVHSMVEFRDGSILAHLGKTDMKVPIQYAFSYPERIETQLEDFDLCAASPLEFEPPDRNKFPCLDLAYHALKIGGTAPAVLNGANEIAVGAFLKEQIKFRHIPVIIEKTLECQDDFEGSDLVSVLHADHGSKQTAKEIVKRLSNNEC